jgi:DNA-binding MarR family transcriptional regulator
VRGVGRLTYSDADAPLESLVCEGGFLCAESLSRSGSTEMIYFECRQVDFGKRRGDWPRVYGSTPTGFKEGRARMAYVGSAVEIKKLFRLFERLGLRTRTLSLTDETLDPNSPMACLTERQRKILLSAYKLGYYDVPRTMDSEKLARALELDKSTVVEHLRKAEKRLLRQVIGF